MFSRINKGLVKAEKRELLYMLEQILFVPKMSVGRRVTYASSVCSVGDTKVGSALCLDEFGSGNDECVFQIAMMVTPL
jgi:hypothetical protein